MPKESKEKGKMYEMYGNYVQVPYSWYGLCRKYIIPKEIKVFNDKKENCIELNPMEINVLAYLANYDECYVTNNTIAEVFNVKKKTIEKYIKELRWVGFIKTFENKDIPTYTDRRDIYVQHDAIKKVLEYDGDIYHVPYECGVSTEEVPYECNLSTLQTEGNYPTDVTEVPYTCETNNNKLEYIKINKNKVASLQNASLDEIDFKCKVKSISNEIAKRAIDKNFEDYKRYGYTDERIIDAMVKEMTGAFYQADKETVIAYTQMKLKAC
jgi:DNA-binding MarR family transcriptional regulator